MMHYWGYGFGYNPIFSILGLIFQVLFWVLIIMLIVKLFRHADYHSSSEDDEVAGDRSLEIVRERYAKGEINKKEFEQLTKDLS
jgi:putative membrane protein